MDERTPLHMQRWVDVAQGVVSREVFVSDEVYRREIDRIFERNWVYLAHETEIPEVGNFVVRTLGNAPVIVVRDSDNRRLRHPQYLPASRRKALPRGCRDRPPLHLSLSRLELRTGRQADHHDVRLAFAEGHGLRAMESDSRPPRREL